MIFNDGVSIVSDDFRCVSLVSYCRGGFSNSCYAMLLRLLLEKVICVSGTKVIVLVPCCLTAKLSSLMFASPLVVMVFLYLSSLLLS